MMSRTTRVGFKGYIVPDASYAFSPKTFFLSEPAKRNRVIICLRTPEKILSEALLEQRLMPPQKLQNLHQKNWTRSHITMICIFIL